MTRGISKQLSLLFLLACCLLNWSCDSGETEPVADYDYFPLRLNKSLIYQVNETRYTAGNPAPTVQTWFEKDEAIRRSESADGFPVFVFARSRRNNPSDPWQKVKEFTVTQYPDKYLFTVDNVTTVPLVFPIRSTTTWDLNGYNSREPEDASYKTISEGLSLGSLSFDRVIQVTGRDMTTDKFVRYNLGFSQYAYGVGLIYDEQTDYYYCQDDPCLGLQQIESGVSTIKQLISYEQ